MTTTVPNETDQREASIAAGLRAMADFIQANYGDLPRPYGFHGQCEAVSEEQVDALAAHFGVKTEDRTVQYAAQVWFGSDVEFTIVYFRPKPAPAVDDEPVQTWWFTFGEGHTTTGGASLAGNYVRLTGTCDGARALMHSLFGNQWCDQYPSAERAGVQEFGLVEYMVGAQS